MIKLLIISDDFTGALDTSVHFAQNGARTKVVFEREYLFTQDEDTEVIVIDAETRHISPEETYDVIYSIVKSGLKAGIQLFYLKTDSALRGNIGSSIKALSDAYDANIIPFIPAYPSMNRFTIKGIQYIDNIPVHDSIFGNDPFNPVKYSSVKKIIAQQSDIDCIEVSSIEKVYTQKEPKPCVAIYDTVTDLDISRIACGLMEADQLKVMAGCAGFASILPEILDLNKSKKEKLNLKQGIWVISGSINPITMNQIEFARENGFKYFSVFQMIKNSLLNPNHDFKDSYDYTQLKDFCKDTSYLIIDSSSPDMNYSIKEMMRETENTLDELRQRISQMLGEIIKSLFHESSKSTLLVTGGDTLIGFLKVLGAHEMSPKEEIMPGIVVATFCYEDNQHQIITKSGGFGEKDLLLRLAGRLNEKRVSC